MVFSRSFQNLLHPSSRSLLPPTTQSSTAIPILPARLSDPFPPMSDSLRRLFWSPAAAGEMDWVETPAAHILKINVPGLAKDEIKIELEEGSLLSIRGDGGSKEEASLPKEAVWHLRERGSRVFHRQLVLPDGVKADQIRAAVDGGVLTVVVPKDANPKSKARNIAISSKL